ncbi:class I SAM-dependent methyltransferase [Candidatus Parcubacteria bacterium]|nr:class I SAM-dependent methyltransferase [Candidatus Parcubacteria bacterium]
MQEKVTDKAIIKRDTAFYDSESGSYSSKRYPEKDMDYVHFFFKRRRDMLMGLIARVLPRLSSPTLMEVGCADGVILESIHRQYPQFSRLVGVDISPQMIREAKERYPAIEFYVRGEGPVYQYDLVVEVGVLNLTDLDSELVLAKKLMKPNGFYICSVASVTSSRNKFVPIQGGFRNHMSFGEYDSKLKEHFNILHGEVFGLHMPLIWRAPSLAGLMHRIIEPMLKSLVPNLFHEKMYLLAAKD